MTVAGTAVCVAGGVGAAVLYPIARRLAELGADVVTVLGARTAAAVVTVLGARTAAAVVDAESSRRSEN